MKNNTQTTNVKNTNYQFEYLSDLRDIEDALIWTIGKFEEFDDSLLKPKSQELLKEFLIYKNQKILGQAADI